MFATSTLEPFPTINTIAKLIASEKLIVADNLAYNKRQKPNQISVINDISITLEVTNKGLLNSIEVLNKDVFDRKLLRSINDHFQSAPYFNFFFDEISMLITSSNSYQSLSINSLKWLCNKFDIYTELELSSKYSETFNLETICSKKSEVYLVEPSFINYLKSINISNYNEFSFNICSPKNYHRKIPQDISFFELIFEWGPYFSKLIQIA